MIFTMSVDNIDWFLIQAKQTSQLFVSPFILSFQKSNSERNSLYRTPIVLSIQFFVVDTFELEKWAPFESSYNSTYSSFRTSIVATR